MSESEVRALRAQVYCGDCSDKGWEASKENWMRPDSIEWLKEKAKRPLRDFTKEGRNQP